MEGIRSGTIDQTTRSAIRWITARALGRCGRAGEARERGVRRVGRGLGGLARRLDRAREQALRAGQGVGSRFVHALRERAGEPERRLGALLYEVDAEVDERAEL